MYVRTLSVTAALVAGLLCASAEAAIVANPFHNYETPDDGSPGTWEDSGTASGGDVRDWSMATGSGVAVASVTDSAVTFTSAYSFPGGTGDIGGTTGSFGDTTSNKSASFELWFRVNDAGDVDTAQPNVLFETGGSKGTSFFLENDGTNVTLTGVTGDNSNVSSVSYTFDANDFGAFLQATLVTGSQTTLFVNNSAAPGDPTSTTSTSGAGDWTIGGNDSGLGRVNAAMQQPATGGAGDWDTSEVVSFKGDIAIFRHYDNQEFTETQVDQNFEALIPEPATVGLLALGGAAVLPGRKRRR